MKRYFVVFVCAILTTQISLAQVSEEKAIKKTITEFVKAGDAQNVEGLSSVLDDAYRVVFNRAFGGEELQIIDREAYLGLMSAKKIGGDKRKVDILSLDINDHIAFVEAELTGKKAKFMSYLILAKNASGDWKLISDTPKMEAIPN